VAFIQFGCVEFQVAHNADDFRPATDIPQARGVGFILRADAGKRSEERPE
jgi:hypothetical protein